MSAGIKVTRCRLRISRWVYSVYVGGGMHICGWTLTKRGARRAAERALREEGAA